MKILFLSHKIPFPPNKGDRIPTYYRMVHLAKQGHELSMVFPCFSEDDQRYVPEVKKFCKTVDTVLINPAMAKVTSLWGITSRKPLTLPYFYSPALQNMVKARLKSEKFDAIYAYSSSMAQYVFKVKGVKKIMDLADSDSRKWLQYAAYTRGPISWLYQREGRYLEQYEQQICKEFDEVIAISEDEEAVFKTYIKDKEFAIVPNGVDLEYFAYESLEYNPKQLVFVGAMDYYANVDCITHFVHNILPLIRVRVPDVKLYIVGANPTAAVRRLGLDSNIIVTGRVDDVRPYLKDSCCSVAPFRIARGIQNKILQAMASGVPVVTSSKGNEGINAVHGESIYVTDEFQEFADYVVRLITDSHTRMRISHSGRSFVKERFQWEKSMNLFESILKGTYVKEKKSELIYG